MSEQRRALLLPQEVKELGAEEAIVFYEGLRPSAAARSATSRTSDFDRRLLPPPIGTHRRILAGRRPCRAARQ